MGVKDGFPNTSLVIMVHGCTALHNSLDLIFLAPYVLVTRYIRGFLPSVLNFTVFLSCESLSGIIILQFFVVDSGLDQKSSFLFLSAMKTTFERNKLILRLKLKASHYFEGTTKNSRETTKFCTQ